MTRPVLLGFSVLGLLGGMLLPLFVSPSCGVGFGLGVAGTGFNNAALWWAIRLFGTAPGEESKPRAQTILIVLAVFVKLPVIVGLWLLAGQAGAEGPLGFLLGLTLVYFATLVWALVKR